MYRAPPDLEVRVKEPEQELVEARQIVRAGEREVYAARRKLRARKVLAATSVGGLGSLAGTILGTIAWTFLGSPIWVILGSTLGFLLAFVSGYFRYDADDG